MKPCLTAIVYGYMWVMDWWTLEDGTDMLYRNVATTAQRCVTYQKIEDIKIWDFHSGYYKG